MARISMVTMTVWAVRTSGGLAGVVAAFSPADHRARDRRLRTTVSVSSGRGTERGNPSTRLRHGYQPGH